MAFDIQRVIAIRQRSGPCNYDFAPIATLERGNSFSEISRYPYLARSIRLVCLHEAVDVKSSS